MDEETPEPYLIRGDWRFRRQSTFTPEIEGFALSVAKPLDAWLKTPDGAGYEVLTGGWFQFRSHPPSLARLPLAVVYERIPTLEINWVPHLPLVVAEVFFGKDRYGDLCDRIHEYLDCGILLVWVIEPRRRTVTVYRPDAEPVLFNRTHTLTADPHLPGFSCPVADLFR